MRLSGDKKTVADLWLDFLYKERSTASAQNFNKFLKREGMNKFFRINKVNLWSGGEYAIEFESISDGKKHTIEWVPK